MSKKKKILFTHQNFPGQFKHLAPALVGKYEVHSLSLGDNEIEGIQHHKYSLNGQLNTKNLNRLTIEFESKMIRALSAGDKCLEIKKSGFNPDLIISHPGWGENLLLKEIWKDTKLINYFEFYYNTKDSDVDFDLKEQERPKHNYDLTTKLVARNAPLLLACNQSDLMIAPTNFQKSTAPLEYRDKIKVIHEGVDTEIVKKTNKESIDIYDDKNSDDKVTLTKNDKVITFVNRNLEPYRGYHIFMRCLPEIIKKHPDAYILIIGGNEVSYGASPKNGSYKDLYFNEIKNKIPENHKIKFLGRVPYEILLNIFGISSVHVYLTYPFVLSWSMLEAMSMEALILGSKTPPVEEVIINNKNGLLVDFFDHEEMSQKIISILNNPKEYEKIRKEARKFIVKNYDLKSICLPKQIDLIEGLL